MSSTVILSPDLLNLGSNDHVLIDVSSIGSGIPRPYPEKCTDAVLGWHDNHSVRLPLSSCAPTDVIQGLIRLTEPKSTIESVTEIIDSYQPRNFSFHYLHDLFSQLSKEQHDYYLETVIPRMAKLALRLPELITRPIPRLLTGSQGSVTFSQEQVACLLAHAFFCTFPEPSFNLGWRKTYFNFEHMYKMGRKCKMDKIKCLLHYFDAVLSKMPDGVITVRRYRVEEEVINFADMDWNLCDLVVHEKGRIEDTEEEMVEIDFANKYIGGGVLNAGCVQEEIRFVLSPELLISMMICERMDDREAISIIGAQRINNYTGYGDAFKFAKRPFSEPGKRDRFKRILSEVVAINATNFGSKPLTQFEESSFLRELIKAYSGFTQLDDLNRPIATGNWGCGIYRGDKQLKSMIQLIAASAQRRPRMCYFTFDDKTFSDRLTDTFEQLKNAKTTVGGLFKLVLQYINRERIENDLDLFQFINCSLKESHN